MTTIGVSLPEHRIRLPLQTLGDAPQTLNPTDVELERYRQQSQRIFDQGGRMKLEDISSIVSMLYLER